MENSSSIQIIAIFDSKMIYVKYDWMSKNICLVENQSKITHKWGLKIAAILLHKEQNKLNFDPCNLLEKCYINCFEAVNVSVKIESVYLEKNGYFTQNGYFVCLYIQNCQEMLILSGFPYGITIFSALPYLRPSMTKSSLSDKHKWPIFNSVLFQDNLNILHSLILETVGC